MKYRVHGSVAGCSFIIELEVYDSSEIEDVFTGLFPHAMYHFWEPVDEA